MSLYMRKGPLWFCVIIEIFTLEVECYERKVLLIKLAVYLDRYLSSSDTHFLETIEDQITKFIKKKKRNCVLLFPPVNSYQRLLIHKTVEQYTELFSFSVGAGDDRRTVACYKKDLIADSEATELMSSERPSSSRGRGRGRFKDVSPTPGCVSVSNQVANAYSCTGENRSHPQKSKAAEIDRNSRGQNKQTRTRSKRPEIQVYVPRGKRLLQEQQQQNQDGGEEESWDIKDQQCEKMDQHCHGDGDSNNMVKTDVDEKVITDKPLNNPINQAEINNELPVTTSSDENKSARKPRPKNQVYVPPFRRNLPDKQVCGEPVKCENIDHGAVDEFITPSNIDQNIDASVKRISKNDGSPEAQGVKRQKKKEIREKQKDLTKTESNVFIQNAVGIDNRNLNFVECDMSNTSDKYAGYWKNSGQYLYQDISAQDTPNLMEPEIDDGTAEYLRNEYLQALGNDFPLQNTQVISKVCDLDIANNLNACDEDADDNGMVQEIDLDYIEIHSQEDVIEKDKILENFANSASNTENLSCDLDRVNSSDDEIFDLCPEEPENKTSENSDPDLQHDQDRDLTKKEKISSELTVDIGNQSDRSENEAVNKINENVTSYEKCYYSQDHSSESSKDVHDKGDNTRKSLNNLHEESDKSLIDKQIQNTNFEVMKSRTKQDDAKKGVISDVSENKLDREMESETGVDIEMKCDNNSDNTSKCDHNSRSGDKVKSDTKNKQKVPSNTAEHKEQSNPTTSESEEEDEDSWDKMFDEDGECLDPKALEELTSKVGKVKIKKATIDYLNYQPKDTQLDYDEMGHIIEIYDFSSEFETKDLLTAFQQYASKGFDIKWVDDTHALGVFASPIAAQDALKMTHPLLKVRCLSESSRQCKVKARRCTEFLQPYKPRPETSAVTARRLVTGALGLAPKLSKEQREQREKERKLLKEAREKKKQDRRQRDDIWEGTYKGDTEHGT